MAKLIQKKKKIYPPSLGLDRYLREFSRSYRAPIEYDELLNYSDMIAIYDERGEDTLWSTVHYHRSDLEHVHQALLSMYAFMRTDGNLALTKHLLVDRVDLCLYGNTKPFRIRIINGLNDNFEYFYIKQADMNRIVGLELEHILSPNRIGFFCSGQTLIEEHIYGIPGDTFRDNYMHNPALNPVRLAKEFVKFNERCLYRLLGDMHAANFVIDITMDFELNFYRIRAIDFDQECYEGRLKVYRPQFFSENKAYVDTVMSHLNDQTIKQYQQEERSMIAKRIRSSSYRLTALLAAIRDERLAPDEHVKTLRAELGAYHKTKSFDSDNTMAALLQTSLELLIDEQL